MITSYETYTNTKYFEIVDSTVISYGLEGYLYTVLYTNILYLCTVSLLWTISVYESC